MPRTTHIGFFKQPQGVFKRELIKRIEDELRKLPNTEVHTGLDFRTSHVINGQVWVDDVLLNDLDVYFWHDTIRPAEWAGDTFALNALEALETDCVVVNNAKSTRITNDKYLSHLALQQQGLPVSDFALCPLSDDIALKRIYEKLGPTLLIKPRFGSWGAGIVKVESLEELQDAAHLVRSFTRNNPQHLLMERYHENDLSKWISVVVWGGKVLLGYRKKLPGNTWKIHDPEKLDAMGKHSVHAPVSAEVEDLALKAAEAIGRDIIGFDMIWTKDGYQIIDENSRPGIYQKCLDATNTDMVEETVRLIRSKIRR